MVRTVTDSAGGWHGWNDFLRALRSVPPTILHGMLAAAVLCVLVPAFVQALQPATRVVRVAAPLPAEVAPEPPRSRCPGCGVVQAIRPLSTVTGVSDNFEFTVRLRDGSLRISTAQGQGSWRVGDSIILMGGDADRDTN
jgi:hypothetical protein